jgi:hypothetical protein
MVFFCVVDGSLVQSLMRPNNNTYWYHSEGDTKKKKGHDIIGVKEQGTFKGMKQRKQLRAEEVGEERCISCIAAA